MLGKSARPVPARMRPFRVFTLVCVLVAAALPGTVRADDPGTQSGVSAIQQYVEQVPTATGPSAPGVGGATTSRLSSNARRGLSQVSPASAAALTTIATSSAYGAPVSVAPNLVEGDGNQAPAGGAVTVESVSDERLVGLVVVLILTTLAGLALAGRRARP